MYFGCRTPDTDFLYREELEQAEKEGHVTLHTAFSRIKDKPKTHVQHLMKQDASQLLLHNGAHLYICGDGSQMASDVEIALLESLKEYNLSWLIQKQALGCQASAG
ncbi:hypothetical protein [Metabacillus sp. RGM 3146]|uniref:hypothetical protein n=1 Tax=Metabacillus sp. RGM 3146 TaxID=3401092 RepID=UPI003B9C3DD7